MPNFFQITNHLKNSAPHTYRSILTLLTSLLLSIGICTLFPISPGLDQYAWLENLSTCLLISLIGALLLTENRAFPSGPFHSILLGASLGLLVFINLLGLKMVDPTQIPWLMRGDWEWQFLGWHIFRHENWQFPLGKITGFWYPIGTSIGYTDSIPLFALLFKPLSPFLPADFQYIGLWFSSCFILQGIFAALLLRQFCKSLRLQTLGILFFLLTPILIYRIGHPALCAHWLLLAALWLYVKDWNTASSSSRLHLKSWLLLTSLSAATHPYLTVMVLGLALAFYTRIGLIERQPKLTSTLLPMLLLGLTTLFIWWQIGYFILDQKNMELLGIGYYSMNLLSPLNSMGAGSLLFRDFPFATEGQYEGMNYLGAGGLIMGLWAGYELKKRFIQPTTFRYFLPLIITSLLFFILAVSNKITLGSLTLVEFQGNFGSVLNMFRTTGRFFWPVHYLLLLFILGLLIKRNSQGGSLLFLTLGLAFQLTDLSPVYYSHHQVRHNPALHWNPNMPVWENPLQSKFWQQTAAHYQHITLLPPIACGKPAAPYQPFAYWAGRYGLTLNTGHLARFDVKRTEDYCRQLLNEVQSGQVRADTIYIVHSDYLSDFQNNAQTPVTCTEIDGFMTCVVKD